VDVFWAGKPGEVWGDKMTDWRRNAGQEEVSKTAGSVGNVTQGVRVTEERSEMNEWSNPKALWVE
jgi:hypothetical protein